MLLHFDDEQNTFVEGAVQGVVTGIRNAFDAIETLGKNSIQGVAVAGAASLVGGTIWVLASKGAALEIIKSAVLTLGPGIATTAGMLSLSAVGLVILAGAVKGAFGALQNQPKMETITGLINDQPQGQDQSPPAIPPYRPTANNRRVAATANNRQPAASPGQQRGNPARAAGPPDPRLPHPEVKERRRAARSPRQAFRLAAPPR